MIDRLISRYKNLTHYQLVSVNFLIFIVGIIFLPNFIVYALTAVASHNFIKEKRLRITMVVLFIFATVVSLLALIPVEEIPVQKVETNTSPTVEEEALVVDNLDLETVSQEEIVEILDTSETKPDIISTGGEPIFTEESTANLYVVDRVIDGDTIDVRIDGAIERVRFIGIDTPETVHPSEPIECFGIEASNKAKELLSGKKVLLEKDSSQGERDKYDRLLRYVFLEDGTDISLLMVQEGYAYEFTYDLPYKYQSEFKAAEKIAENNKVGLWGSVCQDFEPEAEPESEAVGGSCVIKGNISSDDEKIYHTVGCNSYNQTKITESKGERWFCSEQDARDAGWRKAMNCN